MCELQVLWHAAAPARPLTRCWLAALKLTRATQEGNSVLIFCGTQAACVDTARHIAAKLTVPPRTAPAAGGAASCGDGCGSRPPLPPIPRDQLPAALAHRVLKPTHGLAEVGSGWLPLQQRSNGCVLACSDAFPACLRALLTPLCMHAPMRACLAHRSLAAAVAWRGVPPRWPGPRGAAARGRGVQER